MNAVPNVAEIKPLWMSGSRIVNNIVPDHNIGPAGLVQREDAGPLLSLLHGPSAQCLQTMHKVICI